MSREEVHAQFCMVLQDTWLFEGTVRENLVYCSENVSDETLKNACKAVGLDHFVRTLPNGYDTMLNEQVSLSQGEKQQLTIARAMIADISTATVVTAALRSTAIGIAEMPQAIPNAGGA